MGCDVHPVIQFLDEDWEDEPQKTLSWQNAAIPDRSRCYSLFYALAGVRSSRRGGVPLSEPRGLPPGQDMHWLSEVKGFLSGEHSATWFTLKEAKEYDAEWLKVDYPESDWPYRQWMMWIDLAEAVRKIWNRTDEQVRFVMDFDS